MLLCRQESGLGEVNVLKALGLNDMFQNKARQLMLKFDMGIIQWLFVFSLKKRIV